MDTKDITKPQDFFYAVRELVHQFDNDRCRGRSTDRYGVFVYSCWWIVGVLPFWNAVFSVEDVVLGNEFHGCREMFVSFVERAIKEGWLIDHGGGHYECHEHLLQELNKEIFLNCNY
jgi:hypothetical protein